MPHLPANALNVEGAVFVVYLMPVAKFGCFGESYNHWDNITNSGR